MRIPLPGLMRKWRAREFAARLAPPMQRRAMRLWAFFARRPALYHAAARIAVAGLALAGRRRGRFANLPLAGAWTRHRDLPAPEGRTFQARWRAAHAGRER